MTVHPVSLCISDVSDICCSSRDLRRIRSVRERLDPKFDLIGDHIGIIDDDFLSLLFAKIAEFIEHLLGGPEVQIALHLCVFEAQAHKKILTILTVFLVEEVGVCRSTDRHTVIICCLYKQFINDPDIILIYGNITRIRFNRILSGNEHIIAQRLYLNIVIQRQDIGKLRRILKEFSCLYPVPAEFFVL